MARKRVAHTIKKGGVADHDKQAGRCFVISPIGEEKSETRKHANKVLRTIVKPGLKEVGYTASRIDQISDTCSITEGIVEMLRDSRICVAILTNLNLNVMYEVGVRHAWDLPLITLAEEGTQLPFDIRDYSTIFYSMESDQKIKRAVSD